MRTRLDTDLETIQREAQLRRIGRDLHDLASAISGETADAVAAVVTRLATATEYGDLAEEGFAYAFISGAATRHLQQRDT